MSETQTKLKGFLTDFLQYLISVGSAAIIIYYVLKYSFGLPADVKSNGMKLSAIEDKVDTTLAMGSFLMNSVYNLEKKQDKLFEIVNETNGLIRNNTRELNNLKKIVSTKVQFYGDSQNKKTPNLNTSLDSFFKARNK